ncbi:uncharacterized protein LOC131981703 [Centropristis striata]|uniref:uncharacterized protein LOC131981703 n=1 Tax=Centropristis striata TaxID=184440 RepID=UPI0027DF23D0|nr:uncharacterized protein LOC131981703 [Centropristis striata]
MAGQQKHLSPQDMLLFCVAVSCVLFGSDARLTHEAQCLGRSIKFPLLYSPPAFKGRMYFTPSSGGPRKVIMDNAELKDPRLSLPYTVVLRDLTKRDDGTFSVTYLHNTSFSDFWTYDVIRLRIFDCSYKITVIYGDTYSSDVPIQAEFLEFTRLHSEDQPKVLWNRTDPQTNRGSRVQVARSGRSWKINDLTQADNGYYSFRAKDNSSLKGTLLEVKEHVSQYNAKVNDQIFIENLFRGSLWTVTFSREGEVEDFFEPLIERGRLNRYRDTFLSRLQLENGGIKINPVESGDSGTFKFKDQQGNLAQIVEVVVEEDVNKDVEDEEIPTAGIYGIIAANIFVMLTCCCCVRKCCCKKSSSKRDESTPPVFNHDSTQPAVPSYSAAPAPHHSYQPTNSFVPTEPTTTSLEPSVHNPVNIHVNPPQPEVVPLRGQTTDPAPTLGSDCLSSDPGPQFELKGLTFLTGPPLSSESTFTDVYTSDKLHFL